MVERVTEQRLVDVLVTNPMMAEEVQAQLQIGSK